MKDKEFGYAMKALRMVIRREWHRMTSRRLISGAVSQSGDAAAGEMSQPGEPGREQEPPERAEGERAEGGARGENPEEGEAEGRKPEGGGINGGGPQGGRPEGGGSREKPEEPSGSDGDDSNASEPASDSGEEAP